MRQVVGDISELGDLIDRESPRGASHPAELMEPEPDPVDEIKAASRFLGRVLVWVIGPQKRSGWDASQIGMRCLVMIAVLRPDLVFGATLEQLGSCGGGVTRQAIHKLAKDFRETFGLGRKRI